jgi:hypothetical protein
MKNYIKFGIILWSVFFMTSCDDFLDSKSPSKFTEETTFDNLDYATKAVLSIYNNLMMTDTYETTLGYFYAMDSDIEFKAGDNDDGGAVSMCRYKANDGNSRLVNTWNLLYQTVERANICIDNLPVCPIWVGEYATEARRLYGESLTLRALCYLELMRNWGDVPFSRKSVQDGDNFYLPRTDRDEIYESMIEDLAEAQQYIPWMKDLGTAERITKGFVKGLRARMALAYAGYSSRTPTETRRGRNWEEYYRIAHQECKDVMESGKHQLNPSFEGIFKSILAYGQDTQFGEILFELAYGRTKSGRVGFFIGMQHNSADNRFGQASSEVNTSPYYFYSFDTRDLRRNVSVELYSYREGGDNAGKQRMTTDWKNNFKMTKWRKSWITPSMGGDLRGASYTGVNWPLMRYSDIVLMFAETENELNGPTAAAKEALSSVRRRAFSTDLWNTKVVHYVDSVSGSKNDFFNAIVDERAWEFGGEMLRKYDLVRWNLLGAKLKEAREENMKIATDDPKWQQVPDYIFWRYSSDGYTLDILNQDYRITETTIPGYTRSSWVAGQRTNTNYQTWLIKVGDGFDETKNNHLYPIATSIILRSNGTLDNNMLP